MSSSSNITLSWRWPVVTKENSKPAINFDDLDNAPTEISISKSDVPYAQHEALRLKFIDLSGRYDELLLERKIQRDDDQAASMLNGLIEPFSTKMYWFMCAYCAVVAFLVATDHWSQIPTTALDLMVGSTAVTVFGLFGTVLTGIYAGARPKR